MQKRLLCLILSLILTVGLLPGALAAEEPITAPVTVDGVVRENFIAVQYKGVTYLSAYGATTALRPDAVSSWEEEQMVLRGEDFTLRAKAGCKYIEVNGRYLYVPHGVILDEDGDTLVPVHALAKALGATVSWDGTVVLTGGGEPLASGETFYDAQALDLLSRVITHESGNQVLEGKMAVGNVILNRVAHKDFPNTVYDVVYQRGQFTGATEITANAESILAAKLCLEGANVVPGAYWFNGVGQSCWASRHKSLITTIGGHAFYG